jgi:hypothetical protein
MFLLYRISYQIATIGLAADENPFGVVLGGIVYELLLLTHSLYLDVLLCVRS